MWVYELCCYFNKRMKESNRNKGEFGNGHHASYNEEELIPNERSL